MSPATNLVAGDLTSLAAALSALALGTVVAAQRAFPGWASDWRSRAIRSFVLVAATAYLVLAGVVLQLLVRAIAYDKAFSQEDVELCVHVLGLGIAILGGLFLLSLLVPETDADGPRVQFVDALLVSGLAVYVALVGATAVLDVLNRPIATMIVLLTFVTLFAAFEAAVDWVAQRAALQMKIGADQGIARFVNEANRSRDPVLRLEGCDVISKRTGEQVTFAWTTPTQTHVWLELTAAQQIVATRIDPVARRAPDIDVAVSLRARGLRRARLTFRNVRVAGQPRHYSEAPAGAGPLDRGGVICVPLHELHDIGLTVKTPDAQPSAGPSPSPRGCASAQNAPATRFATAPSSETLDGMPPSEPLAPTRGRPFEVRLDAALAILEDEHRREQTLTTRGIAIGTAATALVALLGPTLSAIVEFPATELGHVALVSNAALVVGLAGVTVAIAVLGVLRPSSRQSVGIEMLRRWLQDEHLTDSEATARGEILRATVTAIESRRDVNKTKAKALTWAYGTFLAELVITVPALGTLGFS